MVRKEDLLIDGKRIGKVHEFQITETETESKVTIKYETENGKQRLLTCELEAVSFRA